MGFGARRGRTFLLVVLTQLSLICGSRLAAAQPFVFEQRLDPPSTGGGSDRFGSPVAVDGTTAVVGNVAETVNGQAVGAVHVYVKVGTTWVPQQTIAGTVVGANFGTSIDVSGDRLAVGSVTSAIDGTVRVFVRSGGTWTLETTLTATIPDAFSTDGFGQSVRLRGDRLIVGAPFYETSTTVPQTGAVFVFERSASGWNAGTRLLASDAAANDYFGTGVDISGDTACSGAPNADHSGLFNAGGVYVYIRTGAGWTFQQKVTRGAGTVGQDSFGVGCGVDGDTLVATAGSPSPGRGIAFTRANGTWTRQQELVASVSTEIAIGSVARVIGDLVAVGGRGATIQQRTGTTWTEVSAIQSGSPGDRVIAFDGQSFVQARSDQRAAYVYSRGGTTPTVPGAPVGLQAMVSGNAVNLSWRQGSGGTPTMYTVIARFVAGGPIVAQLPVGTATSLDVTAPDGTYLVSVRASNAIGTGPESSPVTVIAPQTAPPPGAPVGLTATVSASSVTFGWTAPAAGPVSYYRLVAGVTPGFTVPVATVTLPATPGWMVSGVGPGTYYVRLYAGNAGGLGPASNEVTLTVAGPTPPGAPTLAAATVTGNTVSLSWTPGAGPTPTVYGLTASATPGGPPLASVTLTGTSASFPGVARGTYYLRMTASNAIGTSAPSNEVMVVVP